MSDWLICATELVTLRSPQALSEEFADTIKRRLGLKRCLLLVPSQDGRTLNSVNTDCSVAWSVVDFGCPAVHVLQSGEPMSLTPEELLFWQSDSCLTALTKDVNEHDRVHIQPLSRDSNNIHAIMLSIGPDPIMASAFNDESFIKYTQVFNHQWALLKELMSEECTNEELSGSLESFTNSAEKRKKCDRLGATLIGSSPAMHKLRQQVINAAASKLSVMIQGATGTGKELVAQAVHDFSTRSQKPFVAINCAAIPESLLESELFGYVKGAFSGAAKDKQGLIAQAHGGTLFLDEIGDMPLPLQAKLLRVLESKLFRPVGSKSEQRSDFRLVSATHINLAEQVKEKGFRQDLYYRLYQYPLTVPELFERKGDIEILAAHFITQYNSQNGTNVRGLHYKAQDRLMAYTFPGNVRELKHLIEFGCAQTPCNAQIGLQCFAGMDVGMESLGNEGCDMEATDVTPLSTTLNDIDDLNKAIRDYEYQIICDRLNRYAGNQTRAAESLGVPRKTLVNRCKRLEIEA
jgi:sigma-54-specific transcriptional regulator